MASKKILLAGESWMSAATHHKGWDHFGSVTFHLGAEPLVEALKDSPFDLTYMPAHEAATDFPLTAEGLNAYDAVILSDIGSNTLLLHPDVWIHGKPVPNRLKLLRDYVAGGGGLMMIGGYYSFQGINGGARYHRTPIEEVLPVTCHAYDDRIEVPEGFKADVVGKADHPILDGLGKDWPILLGVNEVQLKPDDDVELLARLPADEGGHPLLVTGHHGKGRTIAWTSDIGPHWVPGEFAAWQGFGRLWRQCLGWLTDR
ncbi:MAG: glutamine amidotransferase [Alphaproteobacteria bacterium]|nr:glutamine amidotransferase [Alphaproteobacteria bacterium]